MLVPTPLSSKQKAERLLARHKRLLADKQPWLPVWELLSEFVLTRKQGFTTMHTPGQFLTGQVFNGRAGRNVQIASSALLGWLWPGASKAFRIDPPYDLGEDEQDSKEVREYYYWMNQRVGTVMDSPKAGWVLSLDEQLKDQLGLGTSGVVTEEELEDDAVPIRCSAVSVKETTIAEGKDKRVDTVYRELRMSKRELIQTYGIENCPPDIQKAAQAGHDLEGFVFVVHGIEPRIVGVNNPISNTDMPFMSLHVVKDSAHVLLESGYEEMPIPIVRFWKMTNEVYGRCPASEAFPDIFEVNVLSEAGMIATEKVLDPPLAVTEDSAGGGNELNTGAGQISVRHVNGRIGDTGKWIEPIFTVGELQSTYLRIDKLDANLDSDFFLDLLLDLNNTTRMTLGEAVIRDNRTRQALGSVFIRQIAELIEPTIHRVIGIMARRNLLGVPSAVADQIEQRTGVRPMVIPDAVLRASANGEETFRITYISPAAVILRAEELKGIEGTLTFFAETIAPTQPDVMDNFNLDEAAREVQELRGAPSCIVRGEDEVQKIRDQRAQAQAQQQKLQTDHVQAQTAKAEAQAADHAAKGGLSPATLLQNLLGAQTDNGGQQTIPA